MAGKTVDNAALSDYTPNTITLADVTEVQRVHLSTAVESGTATDLAKAEDAPHASGDFGFQLLGVRKDAATALAGTDGDYVPPIFDAFGRLYVGVPADPFGANVDAAVVTDADGSVSGKLRGLVKMWAERMPGSLGQKTMANSLGVALASDQASIPVSISAAVTLGAGSALAGAVNIRPETTGGLQPFRSIDLDETEEAVKASAGQVYWYWFTNRSAGERFLKFYNDTVANVVVGTTVPTYTFPLAAGMSGHVPIPQGLAFSTAITVAATTGLADNDTGAPGANDVVVNIGYA